MKSKEIKYCVTAFIDLLGFSSHLEVGSDLRTSIGNEAVERLNNIDVAVNLAKTERLQYKEYYPDNIEYKRINDALVITMDLPDILIPAIGDHVRSGFTANEMTKFFDDYLDSLEEFEGAYEDKMLTHIRSIQQFTAICCRIFDYINNKEQEMHFPGAKGVVCTGFRKQFKTVDGEDDPFSANFSFSNAYLAEHQVKGKGLYIDNYILQLMRDDKFSVNVIRNAMFLPEPYKFDPLEDDNFKKRSKQKFQLGKTFTIDLFRKPYYFRRMDSTSLAYLQILHSIYPYLTESKKPRKKRKFFNPHFNEIKDGRPGGDYMTEQRNVMGFLRTDIGEDIKVIMQLILRGDSSILNKKEEERMKKDMFRIT